jgi:hypothetical protein
MGVKMTDTRITLPEQTTGQEVLAPQPTRRGFPVYGINPSVREVAPSLRDKRPVRIERDNKMMIYNPADGQIFGEGDLAFVQREVVDKSKFIKVYLDDLRSMFDLSKTGQRIFQLVWEQLREAVNQDKVELNPRIAKMNGMDVSERAFQKGVRELLEKEFVFMSLIDGVYYINMARFFNGNRIIKIREYTLEGTEPTQQVLALTQPEGI